MWVEVQHWQHFGLYVPGTRTPAVAFWNVTTPDAARRAREPVSGFWGSVFMSEMRLHFMQYQSGPPNKNVAIIGRPQQIAQVFMAHPVVGSARHPPVAVPRTSSTM